jgi:DNA recombination protein Rad52
MAFTNEQREALKSKLSHRHVRNRMSDGVMIPYVEGWHVIAEANRIFGHDGWSRTTVEPRCVWRDTQRGQTICFYTAKVCVTVTASGSTIVREGIGTGTGRSTAPEIAHEMALKAAETDATKRALATFGNPFGLALYDKARLQVTKSRRRPSIGSKASGTTEGPGPEFGLVEGDGHRVPFETAQAFVDAVLKHVSSLATLEDLYDFWEANLDNLRLLREDAAGSGPHPLQHVISGLKARARELGRTLTSENAEPANAGTEEVQGDLKLPKEKRIRSKDHLEFVARQPCLVCGRKPVHAHHVRFAQPRAMALKVSDEFTLPLCAGHHDALHRAGDERAWWARHGIKDPLEIAARLWAASRSGGESNGAAPASEA